MLLSIHYRLSTPHALNTILFKQYTGAKYAFLLSKGAAQKSIIDVL